MNFVLVCLVLAVCATPPHYVDVPPSVSTEYHFSTRHTGLRYNVSHVLPLGNATSFPDYFDSRVPVIVRMKVLESLAHTGIQPRPNAHLSQVVSELNIPPTMVPSILQYIKYICSFQHIDIRVHERLVMLNLQQTVTDAETLAREFQEQGFPSYITAYRIYEWYRILFNWNLGTDEKIRHIMPSNIAKRFASGGVPPVVSFPPFMWGERFIKPLLRRLAATGYEY